MPTLTNLDVISRALRKINVNPEGVTPTAEQGSDCLAALNSMFARWEADGIFLQWFSQTSTADNFPCPDHCHDGVIGSLAVTMAPHYGIGISPELALYAEAGMTTIVRKAVNRDLPRSDLSHLPRGSASRYSRITEG